MNEDDVSWIEEARWSESGGYIVNNFIIVPDDLNNLQNKQVVFWGTLPGNVIGPYDPNFGKTLEEVKDEKYIEIWSASDQPKADAEKTFDESKNTSPARRDNNLGKKSNKVLNKKAKGKPLTPKEEDFFDEWDRFLDYSDEVNDQADSSCDEVEDMSTIQQVSDFDASGIDWPLWVA